MFHDIDIYIYRKNIIECNISCNNRKIIIKRRKTTKKKPEADADALALRFSQRIIYDDLFYLFTFKNKTAKKTHKLE